MSRSRKPENKEQAGSSEDGSRLFFIVYAPRF